MDAMGRVRMLQEWVRARGIDALLVTHLTDIRWAVGFTGSHACLLIMPERAVLLTDGRYTTQAQEEVRDAEVRITSGDVLRFMQEDGLLEGVRRACFQADDLTYSRYLHLTDLFDTIVWEGVEALTRMWRARKSDRELEAIRQVQALTDRVFQELLDWIRPGRTEKEIAAEITYRLLRYGAERLSFDPLVAAGNRSALPHATPTTRILREGEPVLLDFGCVYEGYASDMTRMIYIGKASDTYRVHYACVREAQETAIALLRAGVSVREVDLRAREHLKACGLESYFTHSLGHGVGLDIHEWPRISYQSDDVLPAGAVVTVEPGIYLPGLYGIRIEDLLHITETGAENLTSSSRELIELM